LTAIRLGVLGGSFNPIHLGHLHIARQTRELFGLSRVLFAVACTPPHKVPQEMIFYNHRYAMVSLATSGCQYFLPSPVELEAPVSPYSIDTLAKLARRFGIAGHGLHFIAGGDSLLEVAGWHRGAELLSTYNFVFATRPGFPVTDIQGILPPDAFGRLVDCRGWDSSHVQSRLAAESSSSECRIFLVDVGAPEIAASEIRRRAASGQAIDDLVPALVHEYIQKLHLYGER
jgi:nicotinate-nucleotide adenylyltransferase